MGRYIVFGAGSLGCLIGGRLHLAGHDVVLVARGAHRDAMAQHGLRLKTTATDDVIKPIIVSAISELKVRTEDTVVLAMKTQDCAVALEQTASVAPPEIAIICAQSTIEPERLALRLFEQVYAAVILINVAVTAPGVVSSYLFPSMGIVDIGRYPDGPDERAAVFAADFQAAGFVATARPDMMRWKHGRLLTNAGTNVIRAACAKTDIPDDLVAEAREEAARCFRAAKLDFETAEAILGRVFASGFFGKTVDGHPYPGSSTTQELLRGAVTSEIDYTNGEIALLGRTLGIRTPVNIALQQLMREMIKSRAAPCSFSAVDLRRRIKRG